MSYANKKSPMIYTAVTDTSQLTLESKEDGK